MLAAGTCLTSPSYTVQDQTQSGAARSVLDNPILTVTCSGQPDTDNALVETFQESLDLCQVVD